MLGAQGVDSGRAKQQVELACEVVIDWFDAPGAGHFKVAAKAAFQPDVRDDFLGAAMLMQHFGAPLGGQIALLLGLAAKVNGRWWQSHGKLDWFAFEIGHGEEHNMSLRRRIRRVNSHPRWIT